MDTLDQLRIRAGLRVNELADLADVSESTLRKMIRGDAVSSVLVYKVLRILSERLGREITINDVSGLSLLYIILERWGVSTTYQSAAADVMPTVV